MRRNVKKRLYVGDTSFPLHTLGNGILIYTRWDGAGVVGRDTMIRRNLLLSLFLQKLLKLLVNGDHVLRRTISVAESLAGRCVLFYYITSLMYK
jgi:hypothetical protein